MEVNPLLDRYLRGDRIHVWSELVQLGGSIGRDAESVVEEVGRRIRHNVVMLTERLLGMGYQFYRQEGGYRFADAESLAQLEEAQRNWGRFPRLLSRIYQDFAWVDFSQADGQISAGEFRGMGWHPQLYLLSMPECAVLRETMREEAEHAAECMRRYCQNSGEVYHEETGSLNCVFTGPCASNNDMKGFALPCDAVDARYYDDGGGRPCSTASFRICSAGAGSQSWENT